MNKSETLFAACREKGLCQQTLIFDSSEECVYRSPDGPVWLDSIGNWSGLRGQLDALNETDEELAKELDRLLRRSREGEAETLKFNLHLSELGECSVVMSVELLPELAGSGPLTVVHLNVFLISSCLEFFDEIGVAAFCFREDLSAFGYNSTCVSMFSVFSESLMGRDVATDMLASDDDVIALIVALDDVRSAGDAVVVEAISIGTSTQDSRTCDLRLLPFDDFYTFCLISDNSEIQRSIQELYNARSAEVVYRLGASSTREFRNHFTVLDGTLRYLEKSVFSRGKVELKQAIEDARSSLNSCLELNDRFMNFVLPHSTGVQLVEIEAHLRKFTEFASSILPEFLSISFSGFEDGMKDLFVNLSLSELDQSILALLYNSLDSISYRPGGTVEIRVVPRLMEAHPLVEVKIIDNGCGMESEVLARCFEPFFSTRPVGVGSGLGLPAVREFARRFGGDCTISSTPGSGTIVTVTLPVASFDRDDIFFEVNEVDSEEAASSTGRVVVLLVDDDPMVRKIASRDLVGLGFDVIEVDGADAAMRVLSEHDRSIGIVLTDVIMPPGDDGFALRREILKQYPALPVILISGYANVPGREEVPYLIPKPYDLDRLRDVLRQCLQ